MPITNYQEGGINTIWQQLGSLSGVLIYDWTYVLRPRQCQISPDITQHMPLCSKQPTKHWSEFLLKYIFKTVNLRKYYVTSHSIWTSCALDLRNLLYKEEWHYSLFRRCKHIAQCNLKKNDKARAPRRAASESVAFRVAFHTISPSPRPQARGRDSIVTSVHHCHSASFLLSQTH